jgi:small subunit ribosomal protein S8
MMTDPIADMLTRVRNALMAHKQSVDIPASREKEGIAHVLKQEGYIQDYRLGEEGPHRLLKVYLKYGPLGEEVIREIKRVSSPGRRIYRTVKDIPRVANGLGIAVVSTSRGIISDRECRKLKVGGEVLCTVV